MPTTPDPPPSFSRPSFPQLAALAAQGNPPGRWADYRSLGLSEADVPALIDLMVDRELNVSPDPAEHWLPLHAWRALGQLRAVEAIEPLIKLRIDLGDDYLGTDFRKAMAAIGPAAIAPLAATLRREELEPFTRASLAEALAAIGAAHPATAEDVAAIVAGCLEQYAKHTPTLNALLISALLDVRAVQHADLIGRVMTSGPIDERVCGDWEDVQIELGLLDSRITPPPHRTFAGFPVVAAPKAMQRDTTKRDQAKAKAKAKRKLVKASKRRNRR
jgi:hypothetical protein